MDSLQWTRSCQFVPAVLYIFLEVLGLIILEKKYCCENSIAFLAEPFMITV